MIPHVREGVAEGKTTKSECTARLLHNQEPPLSI